MPLCRSPGNGLDCVTMLVPTTAAAADGGADDQLEHVGHDPLRPFPSGEHDAPGDPQAHGAGLRHVEILDQGEDVIPGRLVALGTIILELAEYGDRAIRVETLEVEAAGENLVRVGDERRHRDVGAAIELEMARVRRR